VVNTRVSGAAAGEPANACGGIFINCSLYISTGYAAMRLIYKDLFNQEMIICK
jgi:hypothetical protein